MGLFDKKFCDICGNKIGLLGNRKLKDGNMCKDCAKKISPLLTGRKNFTLQDMKQHLAYRAENEKIVKAFNETRTVGRNYSLHIDDSKGLIVISRSSNYRNDNPDVLQFSQVTGCDFVVDEEKRSIVDDDAPKEEGKPALRKEIVEYSVDVTVHINSPWFQDIEFSVADNLEKNSQDYQNAVAEAEEIKKTLSELHFKAAAAAAKGPVACLNCGATGTPTPEGRCEYCNGVLG
jgi:RecJ-like exonuclease